MGNQIDNKRGFEILEKILDDYMRKKGVVNVTPENQKTGEHIVAIVTSQNGKKQIIESKG